MHTHTHTHTHTCAQTLGAVDYTECIFAEGKTFHLKECLGNDIKPFDGETLVLEIWGM